MRKSMYFSVSLFLVAVLLAVSVFAADNCNNCNSCKPKKEGFGTKLAWGVVNLMMAPVELIKGMTCAPEDRGMAYDLPVGLGHGFSNMTKRLGAGMYEVAPFTGSCPKGYDPVGRECTSCDQQNPWTKDKDRAGEIKAAAMEKK
jgi:hypothetical protein